MIKIFVYAADQSLAEQTVQRLKEVGAESVALLESLKIPVRQPKENRYLFIIEPPSEKLSELATKALKENQYLQEVTDWHEAQTQVLQAYEKQKKRAILIASSQLTGNAYVQDLNLQWSLRLKSAEHEEPKGSSKKSSDAVLGYLVQNLIGQTPPLQELAEVISKQTGHVEATYSEAEVITAYRQLKTIQDNYKTEIRDFQAKLTQLGSLQEESEFLLLQLHNLQEELENNFLKNQTTDAKLAKIQERWNRLLEKHPDYIDAESVKVEVIDPKTQTLKWVVQGLESQGISKGYLEFETFVESGVLGIRFNKNNGRNEPALKNWPASYEGETIDCIPAGKGNIMRQRAMTLRELSTSDWKLLNILPQFIKQQLNDTAQDAKLCGSVTDAANKLTRGINALPKTFRYDAANLKSNKVNLDYEHLWFELDNASYDTYHWPKFEFRLGAANIKPRDFSKHPKLEFPLIDGKSKPFKSWFEESHDEYGSKYELRFDLMRGLADKGTLRKLDEMDQGVISTLAKTLPSLIYRLKTNTVQPTRSREDWLDLINHLKNLI